MDSRIFTKFILIKILRSAIHIRNGTFIDRLKMEYARYLDWSKNRKHYVQLWEYRVGEKNQIQHEIQPGVKMILYADDRLSLSIYEDQFETEEQEFLRIFLRPGDVFFDIGAHFGLFSLIAAAIVGSRGHVYAFEPGLRAFRRLRRNIHLNRFENISSYRMAVSDQRGYRTMVNSPSGFDAWNSLACEPVNPFTTKKVKCTTYDSFAENQDLVGKVTMVKIDVEGWESYVLSGAAKAFLRNDAPILLVEFSDETCRQGGTTTAELYHKLETFGYSMFQYDSKNKRLQNDPLRNEYHYTNILAIKNLQQVYARVQSSPV